MIGGVGKKKKALKFLEKKLLTHFVEGSWMARVLIKRPDQKEDTKAFSEGGNLYKK